jgi:hypothetical protein
MVASETAKYRENPTPRISANQLAEYLIAAPARRQTILRNARYAPTFLVIRYQTAKDAISRYLAQDLRNKRILTDAIISLKSVEHSGVSEFRKNDAQLCIEAIEAFTSMADNKALASISFQSVENRLPNLSIQGVEVSVNFDLMSVRPKGLARSIGGVIFQTSKSIAGANWRADHSRNVSTLLWLKAEKYMHDLGEVDRRLCLTVDIFGKNITTAPLNYKRKLSDLEAACGEISALWERISPPIDYQAA